MPKDNKVHIVHNADNAHLMPIVYEGILLAYVDEVNGKGGKEIPNFVPTKNELLQLVKYWVREDLQTHWFFFNMGCTSTTECRLSMFASLRIKRIASLIGEEEVRRTTNEVLTQFREEQGQDLKLWQIFRWGDEAQWQAVQEEYQRCTSNGPEATAEWPFAPHLFLTSTSFKDGESIPNKYAYEGDYVSPPLAWSQPPDGTRSLAITMCDLDTPNEVFTHWVIFNIPSDCRELAAAIPPQGQCANGALQGKNSYNTIGYRGPRLMRPFHRYQFNIYALDQSLNLTAGISKKQLMDAMECHILDEGQLTVIYKG